MKKNHCLDVLAFGATGDGTTDDTEAIQRAIDTAGTGTPPAPTTIYFPPGTYRITRTLQFDPSKRTNGLEGSGSILPDGSAGGYTVLVWDGPDGGAMLDFKGYMGLKISDMQLDGNKKAGAILRLNSVPGVGSGLFMLERLYVRRGAIGFDAGRDMNMCAADLTFIDVIFDEMSDCGFRAHNGQQLDYLFIRSSVHNSPRGFHFTVGGSSHFILPTFFQVDTCFKIENVGIGSGAFTIQGLFMERGAYTDNTKRMVILDVNGEANISLDGIQTGAQTVWGETADMETPNLILGPGAQVMVSNSLFSGPVARLSGAGHATTTFLTMDNCRFRCASDPREIVYDEYSGFELRNCNVTLDDTLGPEYVPLKNIFIRQMQRYGAKINPEE